MNITSYSYFDLNITEVENVVDVLHDRTDDYLRMLLEEDEYKEVENIKGLMLEYLRTVRSQANILSEIKSRLEDTNKLCNGASSVGRDKINSEMLKIRY